MYFIKNRTPRVTEGSSVPGNGKKSVFCGYFTKNALFLQRCHVLNDKFLTKYRKKQEKIMRGRYQMRKFTIMKKEETYCICGQNMVALKSTERLGKSLVKKYT